MKISACCIIKNEEKNLPAYIEGVKNIADEIIIVDTGSTDNSIKLLENLKEKYNLNLQIYNFEWINDFAAAKNFALSKATGDWIIFLDADEYFDKKYRKKIRPLLKKTLPDKSIIGIDTPILNIDVDNNNAPTSRDTQVRIFRNDKDLRYKNAIHEYLDYAKDEPIQYLEANLLILHTGYSASIVNAKNERNKKIILAVKDSDGNHPITYNFYLAVAYFMEKNYAEAEKNVKTALELMKKADYSFLTDCYRIYLKIKEAQKKPQAEINALIDDALKTIPNHPDFLMLKLIHLLESGDFAEAEKICKLIFKMAKDKKLRKKYVNKTELELPYAHYALGVCYAAKGLTDETLTEFLTALKSYRYRDYFLKNILRLLEGNDEKAEKIIREYYDEKTDAEFLEAVFEERPRDNLYKRFCGKNRDAVSYKLAAGDTVGAVKLAAKEIEAAKKSNLPQAEFRANLKEKLQTLAVCFLFLDLNDIAKTEKELNLLPPSVIAVILRFYGENLPPVDGEAASYNAIKTKASLWLPKNLREKFLALKIN